MSIFGTLNTALTGLQAAQRAMDVTGQNVANASTPGYSRQRVALGTVDPTSSAMRYTGDQPQFDGVAIEGVTRVRDAFLEAQRAAAGATQSAVQAQTQPLTAAQNLLSEPTSTGLQATMDSFFSSWQDLANAPTDSAAANVVLADGTAVADQLHTVATGLGQQWTSTQNALQGTVTQANQALTSLAALNGQIRQVSLTGGEANDLLDQRDTLVRSVASLVGASAVAAADGTVSVNVGGVDVVSGTTAQQLTLSGAGDITQAGTSPPTVSVAGTALSLDSGSAAGDLASLKTDLPGMLTSLNGVATSLRDAVNTIHQTGYTSAGATDTPFFSGTDAASIAVVPTTPADLAIAAAPGTVDGSVGASIGDLIDDTTAAGVLGSPGPSALWRQMTTAVGSQVQTLTTASTVQASVVSAADNAVQSDAGVNMDEEMTNMLVYQRSYEASAKLITTADQMMQTLDTMVP